MGIFKKLGDLARSNIHAFIDQLEDPKKMAEQAILDLEHKKKRAALLLIKTKASLLMAEEKKKKIIDKIQDLRGKAESLLRDDKEEDAKVLLEKKQQAALESHYYDEQLDLEKKAIDTIRRGLIALDEQIEAIKRKSSTDRSQLEKDDAFTTFDRMEEKIEAQEDEVLALSELLALGDEAKPSPPKDFDKNSDPLKLDQELAAMKKKLGD